MNFNSIDCDCDNSFDANKNYCEYIQGNSTDLHIGPKDCEIRVDLRVNRKRSVRIWGQIKDCDNIPVSGVLVKLLKVIKYSNKQDFIGVSHTVTDCNGFYQFELAKCDGSDFKIIVSKDAVGKERTISPSTNDCDTCDDCNGFADCDNYDNYDDCDDCDDCYYPSKPNKPQRPKPCPPPNYPGNYKPNKPSCGFK